jgi:hypothetical protein
MNFTQTYLLKSYIYCERPIYIDFFVVFLYVKVLTNSFLIFLVFSLISLHHNQDNFNPR